MCTTLSDARHAYCLQFPHERTPGTDDLEDHLGEAVNRVVGRLKRMVDREEDCVVGVPYFFAVKPLVCVTRRVRPRSRTSSANGNERLQLELCLYRFDDWAMSALKSYVPHDHELETGEIKLL